MSKCVLVPIHPTPIADWESNPTKSPVYHTFADACGGRLPCAPSIEITDGRIALGIRAGFAHRFRFPAEVLKAKLVCANGMLFLQHGDKEALLMLHKEISERLVQAWKLHEEHYCTGGQGKKACRVRQSVYRRFIVRILPT